jgi:hypothetical protein
MVNIFSTTEKLARGESYWKVTLTTGKTFHEGQVTFDLRRGPRNIVWLEDVVGSGDNGRISELTLCTPEGDVSLPILEPYTAFQLQRGTSLLFAGISIVNCQIIGRVDDRETGACTAVIWDVQGDEAGKHLYVDHFTTVKDFAKWRDGVMDIGQLSYDEVGLRHIGGAP